MGSALSSFASQMGSVLSSFCSPSLHPLPPAPPYSPSPPPTPRPEIKYDVFLSFRGEDTRDNFTSHVDKAFQDNGIDHFIDYKVRRGDEISSALPQAIEESLISVVIFSKNYADSRWCLDELVKILECKRNHGQIVIPIFYEIDPSNVRNQTGSYAAAFARHQKRFKEDLDKVQKWKHALKEAANLSGSDSRVVKPEAKLVENIVEDVLKSLKENMLPCDNKELIGIDSSITELETMLGRGNVGIWGIGGIGKTTLAYALFEKISCQFECSYFADNVREASKQHLGLNCLRRGLLSALVGDENAHISTFMKKMQRKKFLIILDDVSDFRQVEFLTGNSKCLDLKSRIIITSRNKQILKSCCMDDSIYEVKELSFSDALKLFCRNAFKENCPKVDYKELSNSIVKMVGGVPLALKVLGSSLFGKTKDVWESAMEKLSKNFDRNIHEVLKISYEELDDDQQNIFLDIACFFKRWNIDIVKAFMKACGFFPMCGIDALIDRSLITISDNMLTMHDLLQAMGKEIVRQESTNDPGKRSRLWHHKDIYDVLTNETGTETLEGISLNLSKSGDIYLQPHAFAKMQNLRFLHFYPSNWKGRMHVSQGLEAIFTKLSYLDWYGCPLKSLQSNFHSKNLVVLKMVESEVVELWSGSPQLDNLKIINLWWSQHLTRLPDLSKAPNLEELDLSSCTSLTEIPSSIQHLPKLHTLCVRHCENLTNIPDCNGLKSLKRILLDCCYKIKVLPKLPNNFETLYFRDWTSLCEIPSSYKYYNKLSFLAFDGCKSLAGIPDYNGLKSLTHLKIIGCSKVNMLPEFPNNIEVLELTDIPIEELPSSFENLYRLRRLDLTNCSRLKSLPSSVCKFKRLENLNLTNCSKIHKLPDSLGCLTSLEYLFLGENNFESIPESIINLSKLRFLDISYCERLKVLPKLSWARITAVNCTSLEEISYPSFPNDMLALDGQVTMIANFINCFKLDPNALNNFVKDSLLEIQGQAASTKKRFYHKVYQGFPPRITIRYPGSEIPLWFEYQNRGSHIDVNLPPNWINYNFLCFALCIVVAIPEGQSVHHREKFSGSFNVRCECTLKSKDGGPPIGINNVIRWDCYSRFWDLFSKRGDLRLRSNHVEIGSGFHFFGELYDNKLSFQFHLEKRFFLFWEPDKGLNIDYKVEKCGVHLMYGQRLETLDEREKDEPHLEESN